MNKLIFNDIIKADHDNVIYVYSNNRVIAKLIV